MDRHDLTDAAQSAGDHPVVETGARIGYAVNGLVHLLIAWIGIQLATGTGRGTADQSGALSALASTGLGVVLIWVAVIGFALLALWQLTELIRLRRAQDRVKAVSKAIVYAALAGTAITFARGGRSDSRAQSQDITATIMEQPMGRVLVAVIGLAIIGVGGYHVIKGWKQKFLADLSEHPGRWAVVAGRVGYVAKGIALGLVGALMVGAALHGNAAEASGLDGALRSVLKVPFGTVALIAVCAGFAAYAVYSFARARYARV